MIKKVRLTNFRNFKSRVFDFSPKTTVIVGPNAAGKTNILESLYLLSTGKSFKAGVEAEMVNYSREVARVKAKTQNDLLEVVLTRGEINVGTSNVQSAPRKRLLVNGVGRRLFNFAGNFKAVLFAPWDLELVTQSPSGRRKFMDFVLSQVDGEYRRAILSYEKGIRQRNKLLFRIREEGLSRNQLLFWDQLLIKNGDYVSQKREELIDFINKKEDNSFKDSYKIVYDKSAISEARLAQYKNEEVAAATTLVGPHRDDFEFKIGKGRKVRNLAKFGSRGEQRMGVLWLKSAELTFIEESSGQKPTLLLDDIFSELDRGHREIVIGVVKNSQSIITTASHHFIEGFKGVEKIKL